MTEKPPSVVRSILRSSAERSRTEMEALLASQILELEDRVARIHGLGSQYAHVRVSRRVRRLLDAAAAECGGGQRVATDG